VRQRLRSAPARARRRLLLASLAGVVAARAGLGAAFRAAEAASPPVTEAGTCAAAAVASCAACLRAVRAALAPGAARRPGPSRWPFTLPPHARGTREACALQHGA